MNYWNWILYVGASFIALRSLISLMAQHKESYQQELMQKQAAKIAEQEAIAASQQEAAPQETANAA